MLSWSQPNLDWQLERVSCNLCGGDDLAPLFDNDAHGFGLKTVVCRYCGLIFLNPRPRPANYEQFYREAYHRLFPSRAAYSQSATGQSIAVSSARRRLEFYRRYFQVGESLLEIGPGDGSFLLEARDQVPGLKVQGIEASPAETALCVKKGLPVRCGYLADVPTASGGFHHLAAFHVVEHALDPLSLMRELGNRLLPGGHLYLEVPNALGNWRGLGMVHVAHPYMFAPHTLQSLLQVAGFELLHLEALEETLFEASLRAVARKQVGKLEPTQPVPSEVTVSHVQAFFDERLKNWKLDLFKSRCKHVAYHVLGPRATWFLWDRAHMWKGRVAGQGVLAATSNRKF